MGPTTQLNAALAGRYNILREIGRGGMATVYLAQDVRHDRKVAFKVLNPELGAVLGVERFLAEIRVTANLQHPNLLPLFDSGEAEGMLYYVMPFVEGQSLRARLEREKQLPIGEVVHIATAVAGALAYAHQHDVIHRDLKPENILLQAGEPLLADFGIALAVSNAGGSRITQTGLSLGTPQYMSPEQATGDRELDGRADIYSLGAVVYEMLTGEPPHTGPSAQSVIAKVLTDKPRGIRLSRDTVPRHVEAAVERALAKLPADRWATAQEFATAIQGRSVSIPEDAVTPFSVRPQPRSSDPPNNPPQRMLTRALGVGALFVAALGAGYALRGRIDDTRRAEPVAFVLSPWADEEINWSSLNVSPDGRRIVYPGYDGRTSRLYLRNLNDPVPRGVAGSENADYPFFSPDGKWIGYFSGGDLKRVAVDGGSPLNIATGVSGAYNNLAGYTTGRQSAWMDDGSVLIPTQAFTGRRSGLTSVMPGKAPRVAFVSDTAHLENLQLPVPLPDGRHVAFRADGPGGSEDDHLAIGDLRTGRYTRLDLPVFAVLGYLEGHIIAITGQATSGMASTGTLVAVPVDLDKQELLGDPVTLIDSVSTMAHLSRSGTLVYATGSADNRLVLAGRNAVDTLSEPRRMLSDPQLSPDGGRIALTLPGNPVSSVWMFRRSDRSLTAVSGPNGGAAPQWSADGRRVLYIKPSTAAAGIWTRAADGSGADTRVPVVLPRGSGTPLTVTTSPDGRILMFVAFLGAERRNIYYVRPNDGDTARVWRGTEFDEHSPRFSPDGKWVAYTSNESGALEVFLRRFPDGGSRVQISLQGGTEPHWSRDGRRVYYRNGNRVLVAQLTGGDSPQVTWRREAFDVTSPQVLGLSTFDITADEQRVLYAQPAAGGTKLVVIAHWVEVIRDRLRAARR